MPRLLRGTSTLARQRQRGALRLRVLVRLCFGEVFGWSVYTKDIRQHQQRGIISMLAFICLIIGTQYLSQKYYLLFVFFIYSLIYRCRLESQMPIHMQVLKWNWKRTVMYKTIITVLSKYTFFHLAPLVFIMTKFLILILTQAPQLLTFLYVVCVAQHRSVSIGEVFFFLSFPRSLPSFVSQLSILPLLRVLLLFFFFFPSSITGFFVLFFAFHTLRAEGGMIYA